MKFSISLPGMYPGEEYAKAFAAMRSSGYDTFEMWGLPTGQIPALSRAMGEWGMSLSTFCPEFFILNHPEERERYRESLRRALDCARELNCPSLITQVGETNDLPREEQRRSIVEGLGEMAPLLEEAGVTLLVEPLNDVKDHPNYFLTSSREGLDIVREVGSPRIRLLFDVYHQVHMGEPVLDIIRENRDVISHYHLAGHPDRDENLWDGFDYAPVLRLLRDSSAPLGLELFPSSGEARDRLLETLKSFL